jgi:hypothetical protein
MGPPMGEPTDAAAAAAAAAGFVAGMQHWLCVSIVQAASFGPGILISRAVQHTLSVDRLGSHAVCEWMIG